MSYQGPVGDHSPDPYEKYRVDRIEADKQTKGDHPPPFEDPKSSSFALVTYLLALFHKFLKVFQYADSKGIATTTEQTVRANLLLLKEAFELLKREEVSFLINSESALSTIAAAENVAQHFKVSHENVAVKHIGNKYGTHDFLVNAYIYDSIEGKNKIEPKAKAKKTGGAS